jgi:uncharacterized protein
MAEFVLVVHGQTLVLDPQGALYWRERRALCLSDVHLGKSHTFRRNGIAVPSGTTAGELKRLDGLLERYQPERLWILGDLLHSAVDGREVHVATLKRWLDDLGGIEKRLVLGNHDKAVGPLSDALQCVRGAQIEAPFVLAHEPHLSAHGPVIAGHLHPVVRLGDRLGKARFKAFWLNAQGLVLPSFGAFTGGYVVQPTRGDRVLIIADGAVRELKTAA